jgi:uncharacterized protein YndB with AHSA1/START domain
MATVQGHIGATPEDVFAVLANGWLYSGWVVGTSHMRAVEADWPAAGSRLFHASGIWPAVLRDETQVEEVSPGERLVMTARGRPMGEARIELTLAPDNGGTLVTMTETPVRGPGRWVNNPLNEAVLLRRNLETIARLTAIVERHTQPSSPGSRTPGENPE